MFRFTQETSSESQSQCLAKIIGKVPLCLSIWALSVLLRHIPTCFVCVFQHGELQTQTHTHTQNRSENATITLTTSITTRTLVPDM